MQLRRYNKQVNHYCINKDIVDLKIKFKYVRQQPLSRNSSRLNNYTQSIMKFANLVALKSPKQALQRLCQIINNEDQLRKSNFRDVDPWDGVKEILRPGIENTFAIAKWKMEDG